MNAADRRRLTPTLGIVAVLLALLLIALWVGLGRGAHWHDRSAPPELPSVESTTPPPTVPLLAQYSEVWQHPLFSPTRTPEPAAENKGKSSGDLQLTGVIMLPGLKMAILHDKSSGKDYRVVEGQPSQGGPTLVTLHPRSAVVDASGSHLQLKLIPGPSPVAGNAPADTSTSDGDTQPAPERNADPDASAMVTRHGKQDSAARQISGAGPASARARARALKARIEQARRRRAQQDDGG